MAAAFTQNERVDISLLRSATAADHASVEGSMPLIDDGLTPDTYVAILSRLASIVAAWEVWVAASPDRPPTAFIAERNRFPLILLDLEELGVDNLAVEKCELPPLKNYAQLMGAMYVMEGSRLGGQLIARHVEKVLALKKGQGTSYFRGFDERTGRMWSEFVDHLRQQIPDSDTEEVIIGAKAMFGTFGAWMTPAEP
jgi:heme oxygenase